MYEEFKNKVVLVTGGNSGIGKATAFAFAKYGANVVITGRDANKGNEVILEAKEKGWKIDFIQNDICSYKDVKNMIDNIIEKYGHIDIAFNNAGFDGDGSRIANYPEETWEKVITTNLTGVFYCMKYEINEMLKNGQGAIINNISVSGHKGYPGNAAYVASKHGLVGLTKSASMEYAGKQIRINGISPGIIRTPMTEKDREKKQDYDEWVKRTEPIGRIGEPEDVAETILWLCSSKASFITGHILAIDGGILAL